MFWGIYLDRRRVQFLQKNQSGTKERCCHSIISYLWFLMGSHLGVTPQSLPVSKRPQLGSITQAMLRNENDRTWKMAVAECQPAEISSVQT